LRWCLGEFMITQEQLREMFEYRDDGNLVRKRASRKYNSGSVVGSRMQKGYGTRLHGKFYRLHRLIYMYHYGEISEQVDHINRNPFDNRIENLRAATSGENARNRKLFSNNKSGVKGVCWHKRIKKWGVSCGVNGQKRHFGYFDDLTVAERVAMSVRDRMHGQFANHI